MVQPTNPLDFMKQATRDGTAVALSFADNPTLCGCFPVSQDPRNGDIAFEVAEWSDRRRPPIPGARVTLDVRHLGVLFTYGATLVHVGMDYLVVSRPAFMGRVQRRAWVRVAAEPKAWVRLRDEDGARVRDLRDVSAGGVGIAARPTDDDLAPGLLLPRVEFGLDYGVFVRRGIVRRVIELAGPNGPQRLAGIEFMDVPEPERDRVVSYVLRREMEAMQERRRLRAELP